MIAYLRGTVLEELENGIVLDVNGVGYQVMLPQYQLKVLRALHASSDGAVTSGLQGASIALYTYYHASERQPIPVLVGFHEVKEKEFFELLITVAELGPMSAAKAMTIPVSEFASRIQTRDVRGLSELPGIGRRKAEQIIATLWGKVFEYALLPAVEIAETPVGAVPDYEADARAVLEQLGYRPTEADQMIRDAKSRKPDAVTVQELLEAVWAGQRAG
jgi:holliday junction DNA helicase RuvA